MKTNNKKLSDFLIGLRAMFAQLKPSKLNNKTKALLIAAGLLAGASACHEEPDPQLEPTKTITFDVDWNVDGNWGPTEDTIKYYTNQPDVKDVFINLLNKGTSGGGMRCEDYTPNIFNMARENLEPCFKISDKVKGSGTIIVDRVGGAIT